MPPSPAKKTLLHLGSACTVLPAALRTSEWQVIRWDTAAPAGSTPETVDHVGGLPDLGALADGAVDALFASHQLQRLPLPLVPAALAECRRVLRPGGVAWLVVPDLEALAPRLAKDELDATLFSTDQGPVTAANLLWGPQGDAKTSAGPAPVYRSGFTPSSLARLLRAAGFDAVSIQRHAAHFEMMATARRPALPLPPALTPSSGPARQPVATEGKLAPAPAAASTQTATGFFEQGRRLQTAGQWQQAEKAYQQALALDPQMWPARYEWGVVCYAQGHLDPAIGHVRQALALEPRFARAHAALGSFLGMAGRPRQAVVSLRRAAELDPRSAESHYNLGKALQELNALSDAEDAYRQALKVEPGHALARLNLGKVLNEQGKVREGLALYRSASPHLTEPSLQSSLPMLLNFMDNASDDEVYAAHASFNQRLAVPLMPQPRPAPANAQAQRRLRLAYVSPDLRQHSVRYFLLPILQHHNHQQFEVVAYCDNERQDSVTEQYRALCDRWVDCAALDDATLAQRMRDDGIDILVDLAGHTNRHRLLTLARQPAPVQLTYLGYPATTGITAIDWRISDRWIDPPAPPAGVGPAIATAEKPLRLQHGYYCYAPMADSPDVGPCPFERNGHVTLGSLNQGGKLTPQLLDLWADLMQALPSARLCLQNAALHEKRAQDHMRAAFAARGVAAERLQFKAFAPAPQYLQSYQDIDIALDSFPYNGGTTTCEALWMGVPVVSWCGTRHVSRLGASILNAVGLGELVASSPGAYLQAVLALASSPGRLRELRAGMRQRMAASALMDHAGFTAELEDELRKAWAEAGTRSDR